MTASMDKYKSWAVSLLFHLAILAAMAFYTFPNLISPKWYEVSFDDILQEPVVIPQDQNVSAQTGETFPSASLQDQAQAASASIGQPASPSPTNAPTQGHSEMLETPAQATTNKPTQAPALANNPLAQAALRSAVSGNADTQGSGGVGFAIQGGRVRFTLPPGYKHNLGASGSVTLQFKVDKFARPIPGSIVSTQHTEGRMYEAARKVLLDGNLSFVGEPNPGVSCIITIEFL